MSAIARTLGVSRSNLIERTNKPSKPRGPYRKPEDVALLAELRPIIDQRPTYGYRRVTALLNRQRRRDDLPMVNPKRVLRVMQQNGLTLQKHTALRPTRAHDGVVVALRSNIRWCSDHLEIHARNGEVARIVFVSMPATGRSSPGRPWPMPASPAKWCVTS
jgi:transposase InsO family protein